MANASRRKLPRKAADIRVSVNAIHARMADNVALAVRRHDPGKGTRAIALLVPDLGEDLASFDGVASAIAAQGVCAYTFTPRGHAGSGGEWTLAGHLRDLRAWLRTLRAEGKPVVVVARGLSATLLLLHEEIAHRAHSGARPAVPDAMVLIEPVMNGGHAVPRGLRALLTTRVGCCRSLSRRERGVLHRFTLPPVRIQTPTVILQRISLHPEDPHDPVRRVFGAVNVRRAPWLDGTTNLEHVRADHDLTEAALELLSRDAPHRFRSSGLR